MAVGAEPLALAELADYIELPELRPVSQWRAFTLPQHPGLVVLRKCIS